MWEKITRLWLVLSKSRYTRFLEGEIDRLRDENRFLYDSLLKQNNIAPMNRPDLRELPKVKSRLLNSQWRARVETIAKPKDANEQKTA